MGWEKFDVIFNGVLMAANVVIAAVVLYQLLILKDQLAWSVRSTEQAEDLTRQTITTAQDALAEARKVDQAQLRPWISALLKENNLKLKNPAEWIMKVYYRNVGKTPARDVDMYGVFELHEHPLLSSTQIDLLDPSKDDPDTRTHLAILPGGETYGRITFRPGEAPKSLSTFGNSWLYALGHVRYFDADGKQHYTQYCAAYSVDSIKALEADKIDSLEGDLCEGYQNAD